VKDFFKKHLGNAAEMAKSIGSSAATKATSAAETVNNSRKSTTESISAWKDRRTLEKNLVRRKELAREYEQNRVPAGDPYYVTIYDACMVDIKQFCQQHNEDPDLTLMQYPFMRSLRAKALPLTEDDRQPGILIKAFAAVAAGAVLCFLTGAATGLFQGGHAIVNSFFGS
jgi:hypothetical protein